MSTPQVSAEVAQGVLNNALVDNENALLKQAQPRERHPLASQFQFTPQEDVLRRAREGNGDGWGISRQVVGPPEQFSSQTAMQTMAASVLPAGQDPAFVIAARQAAVMPGQASQTVMAHLLKKPPDRAPSPLNLHPFSLNGWSGMLNGSMRGFLSALRREVEETCQPLLGQPVQGKTASELVLHWFLGRMLQQWGTTKINEVGISEVGVQRVQALFAQVMKEVKALALANQQALLPTQTLGLNFVQSSGDQTMAYRYGRSLFVGVREEHQAISEVILASEPLKNEGAAYGFQWQEVPEDHLVFVSRMLRGPQAGGGESLQVAIRPLASVV